MSNIDENNINLMRKLMEENAANNTHTNHTNVVPEEIRKRARSKEDLIALEDMWSLNDEFAEYEKNIELSMLEKNKCSISEYQNKFILLHTTFENSGYTNKDEFINKRDELSAEYVSRFSVYHPLRLHDDYDENITITTIPPIQKRLEMVSSANALYIDQFIQLATHDRPDYKELSNTGLLYSVLSAQKTSKEEQDTNMLQSVEVLRTLQPDHPLLKKLDAEKNDDCVKDTDPKTNKDDDGDLTLEDFGF